MRIENYDSDCDIVIVNFLFTEMTDEWAIKYCTPIQGSANGFTCHFCDWKMIGDRITRIKYIWVAKISGKMWDHAKIFIPSLNRDPRFEVQEMLLESTQKRLKKKASDINLVRRLTQTLYDSDEEAEAEIELFMQFKKRCQEEASDWFARGMRVPVEARGQCPPHLRLYIDQRVRSWKGFQRWWIRVRKKKAV